MRTPPRFREYRVVVCIDCCRTLKQFSNDLVGVSRGNSSGPIGAGIIDYDQLVGVPRKIVSPDCPQHGTKGRNRIVGRYDDREKKRLGHALAFN